MHWQLNVMLFLSHHVESASDGSDIFSSSSSGLSVWKEWCCFVLASRLWSLSVCHCSSEEFWMPQSTHENSRSLSSFCGTNSIQIHSNLYYIYWMPVVQERHLSIGLIVGNSMITTERKIVNLKLFFWNHKLTKQTDELEFIVARFYGTSCP